MPRKSSAEKSPSAARIRSLRRFLHLSTNQFAEQLGCSIATLAGWESGDQKPTVEAFITLGNLAGDPSCWFFWSCAGVYGSELMRVSPPVHLDLEEEGGFDLTVAHAGAGRHLFSRPLLHAIPILPVRVGTEGDSIDSLRNVSASSFIASPSNWCPNPRYTSCLRVVGDSMAPLICDGYIIVVDASQVDHERLNGELVVAWEKAVGLVVARLKKGADRESLESTNQQYGSVITEQNRKLRIIGKVLWWVGRDAPMKPVAA